MNVWKFGTNYVDIKIMENMNIAYAHGDSMPTYLNKNRIRDIKENDIIVVASGKADAIEYIGVSLSSPYYFNQNKCKFDKFKNIEKSDDTKINNDLNEYSDVIYVKVKWLATKNIDIKGNYNYQGFTAIQNDTKNNIIEFVRSIELKTQNKQSMQKYIDLLKSNRNLILTGAPGTGKTFLAKEIASQMLFGKTYGELSDDEKVEFGIRSSFVQFHPSMDYTDFVEGLRPVQQDGSSEIVFERKDGIFKEFCKNAMNIDSKLSNFDSVFHNFIDDYIQNPIMFNTPIQKKPFSLKINSKNNCYAVPDTEKASEMLLTKKMLCDYIETGKIRDWKPYTTSVGEYIKEKYKIEKKTIDSEKINNPFVFIIDEINRGETSRIFGELFFAIDPGYRGENGKIKTQYQNLIEEDDVFFDGFYVPENVYILGTMNDIDRSVESMDFAMRRRFAWKEINANDRIEMWDGQIDDWKVVTKTKMNSLNAAIEKIDGINSSYHIGPAYFLKLKEYSGDFNQLWDNHLQGVLFEYLRGTKDVEAKMDTLKDAFELTVKKTESSNE